MKSTKQVEQSRVSGAKEARKKVSAVSSMSLGKRLVVAGFAVAAAGIACYCAGSVLPAAGQEPALLGRFGLAAIGLGTLCWFVGAIKYFQGAISADLPEDLFF